MPGSPIASLAAVALQAVHDAELKLGDAVSVHGLGAIGLLTVQMCRLEGIQNVFAIDPDPARRKLDTATRLLYTDRVSLQGLLGRRFPFDQAPKAYKQQRRRVRAWQGACRQQARWPSTPGTAGSRLFLDTDGGKPVGR